MTFAAGLAAGGLRPYFAVYSSFLQRAFDQSIHDVALQNLPVRICVDRAGLVGQDGPTHHGAFDLSFLRLIPGMGIFLPSSIFELEQMLDLSIDYDGPLAIRYARGVAEERICASGELSDTPVVIGEPEIITTGGDVAIVSIGHIFPEAWKFYKILKNNGISATFINLRFLRPLNEKRLLEELHGKRLVVTFEENIRAGSASEYIAILLKGTEIIINTLPDDFMPQGSVAELRDMCGLTAQKVWEKYKSLSF
jgi:1-deoxy-D-xylulose-5-phosphate synthase